MTDIVTFLPHDADELAAMVGPEGNNPAQSAPVQAPVLGAATSSSGDFPTEGSPPFINRKLSLTEWENYVATYAFGSLAPSRLVLHHTYVPDEPQWNGLATMRGMQRFYAGKGWRSGPHIFTGPDGIWLATPMSQVGIHAGTGNGSLKAGWYSIGLEMVGYFDTKLPSGPVWDHAVAVMGELSRRLKIPPRKLISFHRDYTNTKTCPGTAVTKEWVWSAVEAYLAHSEPAHEHSILNGPSVPATTLITYLDARTPHLTWEQRQSIVTAYCAFGEYTGIGNLRPFAQAVKEASDKDATGVYRPFNSRRFRENFNPAGLGATNDGAEGARFSTITAGVAAQYAHLLCYAAKADTLPLHLEQLARTSPRRADLIRAFGLGIAPTWERLNGRWAFPGPSYGQDILTIAAAIARMS